jgi:sterol desaturase/sphingolipid hydroxylase (fatty acid hydroxylase superfamily)
MAQKTNSFEKFWKEMKRRKVFKVVAMYAGTAFIILQLLDIIAQPLQWPTWTLTFVIVLLCIGFIITLLISWIYDITPEGLKKTESVEAA